jgi:NADH-quinone oxidoreductase subunit N
VRIDYAALSPELVITGAACVVLLLDLALRGRARVISGYVALSSTLLALVLVAPKIFDAPTSTLGGFFVLDHFAVVMKIIFLAVAAYVIWIAIPPMRGHRYEGEFVFLLLCSVLGTLLMPSSRDLLMLFVSLELVSAPAFVIAGLRKLNPLSNEAALKFFIFGVLSAGIFVYGISLIYGATGTTSLAAIARSPAAQATHPPAVLFTGIVFIVAAFGFKVSAVPFHFWAPDTYEGAPTPLAAYLSVASKAAGFVGLLLVLYIGFPSLAHLWGPFLGAIAIATMTVGNVVALRQRQFVRLLAYSSIAHAGYMLIPIAIIGSKAGVAGAHANAVLIRSLVIYLLIYSVMQLGAFAVAIGISKSYPTLLVRDLSGLGRRAPLAALGLSGFLIALGGIPPFAGWFGKFALFTAAIDAGTTLGIVLAVAMVVNSVISLFYYLGVVRVMYMGEAPDEAAVSFPRTIAWATALAFIGVVFIGIYPEPFARLAEAARLVLSM